MSAASPSLLFREGNITIYEECKLRMLFFRDGGCREKGEGRGASESGLCDDEARYGEIGVMQLQVGLLLPEGLATGRTSPLPSHYLG